MFPMQNPLKIAAAFVVWSLGVAPLAHAEPVSSQPFGQTHSGQPVQILYLTQRYRRRSADHQLRRYRGLAEGAR